MGGANGLKEHYQFPIKQNRDCLILLLKLSETRWIKLLAQRLAHCRRSENESCCDDDNDDNDDGDMMMMMLIGGTSM